MYSVIIPAYNAEQTITTCIHALQNQTVPRQQVEIIVVDDASTDNTVACAHQAGARVLTPGKLGKSGVRNVGAEAAQGEIILFTDSDCEPRPDWVEQMVQPFANDPDVVGVKGAYLCKQKELVARFTQVEVEERYDRMRRETQINFIDTYAAAYRRDIFLENGGFDLSLPEVEDQDLSFRLAAKGYKMIFAPDARVYHLHTTSAWRYFKRKFAIGKWKAMLMHRHPERLISDSRTPQLLKVQMGLTLLLPFVLLAPLLWQPLLIGAGGWLIAFILSCVPFLAKTVQRDSTVLIIALPLLFLRAVALAYSYGYGTVVLRPQARQQKPILSGHHRLAKRLLDLVLGGGLFILSLPIILLVAVAIRLSGPGPIFFRQQRIGQNGKPFTVYKFRSMRPNAEAELDQLIDLDNLPEPVFKIKDDPRITPLGHFLRRWSLDEIPQFWNVLKGDMSLVGPRPEEARIVARYNDWQRRRLSVRPGITGPMQINGRGELPLNERVRLELDYIEHYTLLTDCQILLKTIPAVIKGTGAW
ncbi:MAG: sugar transferase [Anaerolineae bacterium]|nr:sugar transferase [Anaerolineae bacterium]